MKKKLSYILLLFCMLSKHLAYSQNPAPNIDSLFSVLKTQKDDTSKVATLNALAFLNRNSNPDTALHFTNQALALSEKLNFQEGIADSKISRAVILVRFEKFDEALKNDSDALTICNQLLASGKNGSEKRRLMLMKRALNGIGNIIFYKADYPEAMRSYEAALEISEELDDKKGMAAMNGNIANAYMELGNYPEALKSHFASLKIWEQTGSKKDISKSYNNIGRVYDALNNNPDALKMYNAYMKIAKETGDSLGMTEAYNNIGGVYLSEGNYDSALENLFASLKISQGKNDYRNIGNTYSNIGNVYLKQKKYQEALQNYFSGLKFQEQMEDKEGTASTSISMGNAFTMLRKYDDARAYLGNALSVSKETGNMENIKSAYEGLSVLDSSQGNYKQSLEYYKKYISYKDSLFNEDVNRKTVQAQMQYDFDKKESAAKAEQERKDALTASEISKQKIIRNFSIAGVIGILFLGAYVLYNFRRRKKMENMQALSNERLRISRELHDDIGSTLGSIAVFSDVAKNRSQKNGNPTEILTKIAAASRELIEKMSDIVWSLNPDNETLGQLQNRMQAFAAMILTPQNISFEFKNEGDLNTLVLSNEQRKNLFLIYKEAIHNIVKYAGCKNVAVTFSRSGNALSFSVKDDGKGFDVRSFEEGRGEAYNGNGLKNMKSRAVEMKAWVNITSGNNEGTMVELKINDQ